MKFDKRDPAGQRAFSQVLALGFNVVLTILVGALLGWLLDVACQTDFIIIIGIGLFAIIAIINFFRGMMKIK